jgi:FtsP/CotA-like multicopper oxidase with cupredoxin domain
MGEMMLAALLNRCLVAPFGRVRAQCIAILSVVFVGIAQLALADDVSPELVEPPVCSAATAGRIPASVCSVTPTGDGHNEIKVSLTAQTATTEIAGYSVTTENYNATYLTPVIEAMPGDTLAAHLVNILAPRVHDGMAHGDSNENPTNLHYFHGGLVSPNNARPKPVESGNGDNIYLHLKSGRDSQGNPNSVDLVVPIPGDRMLDARVLEGDGFMAHPLGLNWYHAHLHGIASDQVMGGMSGLLSVGQSTANVIASCSPDPGDAARCLNDIVQDTAELKSRTLVRYALLRDIPLQNISKRPEEPGSGATADWAPTARDFPVGTKCGVMRPDGSGLDTDNPKLRTGFCQRDLNSAWLFTLNGQRFPTITVAGGKNLLLRLGNLSANVGYWLELYNEADGTVLPLTVLSIDGVVPERPVAPGQAEKPIQAVAYNDLLMMPATRSEIYIRNDETPHAMRQVYILRTKGLRHIGPDEWPEIQLARIVLEANKAASPVGVALNAPMAARRISPLIMNAAPESANLPIGCVRDLDPDANEYRRVTFIPGGRTSEGMQTDWSVMTEIVQPPRGPALEDEAQLSPENPAETTVGPVPFEDYMAADGSVDWTKKHVCVEIDHAQHKGSHKQLWVLFNATDTLHNFHIHQMKFRLATTEELHNHNIAPPSPSHTCGPAQNSCSDPDYKFYDDQAIGSVHRKSIALWHDTIPLPPGEKVFIVMSFDAKQQIGRYVFHCHVLKHEDGGLMAPIEVWEPTQESNAH